MSTTVKFAYIVLGGKDIAFVKKGKFGVVQGAIEGLFSVRLAHPPFSPYRSIEVHTNVVIAQHAAVVVCVQYDPETPPGIILSIELYRVYVCNMWSMPSMKGSSRD